MAVGDYAQIEDARRRAWRAARNLYDPVERSIQAQRYEDLKEQRVQYLHELLAQLPFRWHVEHAYTPQETATYGGGDHIILNEEIRIGRLIRHPGDALSRPRHKFWGLHAVGDDRLPNVLADIKIAERLVPPKQVVDRPSSISQDAPGYAL